MEIKLRKVELEDWRLFLKWWRDKELIRLTSGITETSDHVLFGYFQKMMKSSKDYNFIILHGKIPIGHIALSHKDDDTSEVHIVIGEEKYRGKGLGTESIKQVINFAFTELAYKRIILEVRPDNKSAIRAYEKSGFIRGELRKHSGIEQPETLLMSLDKKDWSGE